MQDCYNDTAGKPHCVYAFANWRPAYLSIIDVGLRIVAQGVQVGFDFK